MVSVASMAVNESDEALDARLDEALCETFPASDPIAVQVERTAVVGASAEQAR